MFALLLAVIYLCFVSLGLPDSLFGAGLPIISSSLNITTSMLSFIAVVINIFTVLSALFTPKFVNKLTTKWVVIISICLTIIGLVGFSFCTKYYMFFIFALPYGLGAGAIDAALNNYVAKYYSARVMNFLHCFYGVGAIISPNIMALAITYTYWKDGFLWTSFIQIGILLCAICSLPLWKKHAKEENIIETKERSSFKEAFKLKGVLFILISFFFYCSIEGITFLWTSSFFDILYPTLSDDLVASFGSLIFLGLMVGRIIAGIISNKIKDRNLIRYGIILCFVGVALISLPFLGYIGAVIGFVILGIGMGPIYPSIMHLTPKIFGEKNSGAIISIEMSMAYLGFTFTPMMFGFVQQYISMWMMPVLLFAFTLLVVLFIEIGIKKSYKNKVE